jgi:hypothetical protein
LFGWEIKRSGYVVFEMQYLGRSVVPRTKKEISLLCTVQIRNKRYRFQISPWSPNEGHLAEVKGFTEMGRWWTGGLLPF